MASLDIAIVGLSMTLQLILLLIALWRKGFLLICPILGGLLGLGTLADLLLATNSLTCAFCTDPTRTIQLGGLSYALFLILPVISFLYVIMEAHGT